MDYPETLATLAYKTQDEKNTHNTTQKTRKMNNTWTPPKPGVNPDAHEV
jgi:hypothetical protein